MMAATRQISPVGPPEAHRNPFAKGIILRGLNFQQHLRRRGAGVDGYVCDREMHCRIVR